MVKHLLNYDDVKYFFFFFKGISFMVKHLLNYDDVKYFFFFFKGISLMQIKQSFWKAGCEALIAPLKNFPILHSLSIVTEFSF